MAGFLRPGVFVSDVIRVSFEESGCLSFAGNGEYKFVLIGFFVITAYAV